MPKLIERYQTPDGKEFKTAQAAERHERDILLEQIDAFFLKLIPGGHRPSVLKAVERLEADKGRLKAQMKAVLNTIEYMEGGGDL